ncbi:YjbF family lipoprotein [Albirhodobacter sp. R86504]|uniref:YjbF family lipoprotein n=1 Tax=Albirhodobacter sp. R86504 TaxID=3093848 RepID=UPI00366F16D6
MKITLCLPKILVMLVALTGLSACSSNSDQVAAYRAIVPVFQGQPKTDPAFAAAYEKSASSGSLGMIASIESRPDLISSFFLQTRSDASGVETWIGPGGIQVMMNDGILVGTRGFGADVMAAEVGPSSTLIRSFGSGYVTRLMTVMDGGNHAVTRAFRCAIAPGEMQPVPRGDGAIMARTVTETCRSKGISFDNFYWVVPQSGEIIQSSQWAGLTTDKMSFRLTPTY